MYILSIAKFTTRWAPDMAFGYRSDDCISTVYTAALFVQRRE